MTILTAEPPDPHGYGRIVPPRRQRRATDQVEPSSSRNSSRDEQANSAKSTPASTPFNVADCSPSIDQLSTENPHGEYYLTEIAAHSAARRQFVLALRAEHANEVLGVNTRLRTRAARCQLRERKARELMDNGRHHLPSRDLLIDADVTVGDDTVIEPFVQLLGKTNIGQDCRIRCYSVITNCEIGDNVLVNPGTHHRGRHRAHGAQLGPYSHLRPGSDIGEDAHVGNFVETKKTRWAKAPRPITSPTLAMPKSAKA